MQVNTAFDIRLYEEGEFATFYAIQLAGSDQNELDRFLMDPDVEDAPDYDRLVDRLDRILDKLGPYDRRMDVGYGKQGWLRDEGDGTSALWAPIPAEDKRHLRAPYPSLRLYCFRVDRVAVGHHENAPILIAGHGGIKAKLELHVPENAHLLDALNHVKHAKERLKRRLQEGTVRVVENGFLLKGNLEFESEDLP